MKTPTVVFPPESGVSQMDPRKLETLREKTGTWSLEMSPGLRRRWAYP
jgi:hypothetical protein